MRDPRHRPRGRPTETGPTDAELVEAWRAGDGAALEKLIRRHQSAVYRLVLRTTGDPTAAEDLTQKAFLKAIGRLGRLRGGGAFRTWLFRIALNLARNRHRNARRWRQAEPEAIFETPVADDDPHEVLEARERADAIRAAVDKLPRMQREVVRLRLDADLPFKEIARILDTTEASAKVSFHHAVRTLRQRLADLP